MSDTRTPRTMSELIGPHLPYLRRYARALAGDQSSGDAYAVATLEAILAEPKILRHDDLGPRAALFAVFHGIWSTSGAAVTDTAPGPRGRAYDHLATLSPNTREALLLYTVEEFGFDQVGRILGVDAGQAEALVDLARAEMQSAVHGRAMIIEDEAIIAMDIEGIVEMMGHEVTGIARTRDEAVRLGLESRPDLILADIHLADDSSGIDAVNDLLAEMPEVPVIFITAYPERLLTGERPEPAFMIAKPYKPPQVISAVSQAMFFASTETLKA